MLATISKTTRRRHLLRTPTGCAELAVKLETVGRFAWASIAWKAAAGASRGSGRKDEYLGAAERAADMARERKRERLGVNRFQYVWSARDPMPEPREDGDEARVAVEDAHGFRFIGYTFSAASGRWEENGKGLSGAEAEKLRPVFIAIGPRGWGQAKVAADALKQYIRANGRGGLSKVKVNLCHPETDIYGDGRIGYPSGARPKVVATVDGKGRLKWEGAAA